MIRTRNFKAWNERIETGVVVKSRRNVSVERKVGDCLQWNRTVLKRRLLQLVVKKHNHPLLLRKCRLTEESLL